MANLVNVVGYIVDAWIIGAYALLAKENRSRPFHWANALGSIPIFASEFIVGAYVPMVLTVFFGFLGWYGLLKNQ